MNRRKPEVGDTIRILPDFGEPIEATVVDLLATMFTVTYPHSNPEYVDRVQFLYYDRMKGDSWESMMIKRQHP
jgi:hypothetical protein